MKPTITSKISAILLDVLNAVAERDSNFRQANKLRNTPDERLADMGITREEANRKFFANHTNRPAEPIRASAQSRA